MPSGLKNAPSTYQKITDNVTLGRQERTATYMDDLVIFSTTIRKHIWKLQYVLKPF